MRGDERGGRARAGRAEAPKVDAICNHISARGYIALYYKFRIIRKLTLSSSGSCEGRSRCQSLLSFLLSTETVSAPDVYGLLGIRGAERCMKTTL